MTVGKLSGPFVNAAGGMGNAFLGEALCFSLYKFFLYFKGTSFDQLPPPLLR